MTSGPSYTVGLMLSCAAIPFPYIHVNLREGQHKQPDYLVKNRYGQVPACVTASSSWCSPQRSSNICPRTLHKFDGKTPIEKIRVREWLFWQWDKLSVPLLRLRARNRGFRQFGDDVRTMYDTEAKAALAVIEHELAKSEWIVGKKPTIADIGIFAIVRYAPEAMIDLTPYPNIVAWKKRIEAMPGFGTPEQIWRWRADFSEFLTKAFLVDEIKKKKFVRKDALEAEAAAKKKTQPSQGLFSAACWG